MFRLFGQDIPLKSAILVFTDMALIAGSVIVTAWLRLQDVGALREYVGDEYFAFRLGTILIVCFICFYYDDLYDLHAVAKRWVLVMLLAQALGAACIIMAVLYYFVPDLRLGQGISTVAASVSCATLVGWRLFVDASVKFFRPELRVLVAGTGTAGIRLVRELVAHPELPFKVIGFLDERGDRVGQPLVNPGIIGNVAELEMWAQQERADCVVLSLAERRGQMPLQQLVRLKIGGRVRIEDAHAMYERLTGRIMLEELSPSVLILSQGFKKSTLLRFTKRVIDLATASTGLILFAPLFVCIALAIYLESGMPILFRQRRTGYKGQNFNMLKFRSMRQQTERDSSTWATEGDSRITRVGRFIRKYRLDESPQFLNVLRGEMSMVGPRPEQPSLARMLEAEIPFYAERHAVRPGITGWAQIRYKYGSSIEDAKTKLEYDLFYIKHLSPLFDLVIAFRTVQVMLFGAGAV